MDQPALDYFLLCYFSIKSCKNKLILLCISSTFHFFSPRKIRLGSFGIWGDFRCGYFGVVLDLTFQYFQRNIYRLFFLSRLNLWWTSYRTTSFQVWFISVAKIASLVKKGSIKNMYIQELLYVWSAQLDSSPKYPILKISKIPIHITSFLIIGMAPQGALLSLHIRKSKKHIPQTLKPI